MLAERPLGKLDIAVPVIGFGTAALVNLYQPVPEAEGLAAVHEALAHGIRMFDTSPFYSSTQSEKRLGEALSGTPRDQIILSTKVGRLFAENAAPGEFTWDFSRDGVLRSLEGSLKRLKVDRVDLVYIHDPDARPEDYLTAAREAFPALAELRAQGVVRGIGFGMNQWPILMDFLRDTDPDVILLAGRYTLLEQSSLAFLSACARRKIGVVLGGVFNSGILATGSVADARYNYREPPPDILARVQRIEAICARYAVSLPAVALQFVLAYPAISTALLGMSSIMEVQTNLDALRQPIPAELWRDLRSEGLIDPDAPLPP